MMGLAKEKPLYANPTDYEDDFHLWLYEQAELLRQKRFAEVDLPNVIEELESMGSEQRHALESSYRLIISHLLKWELQPQMRTRSWTVTITRERSDVRRREKKNPSLRSEAFSIATDTYRDARNEAMVETDLPRSAFPPELPYILRQLRSDWMPGEPLPTSDESGIAP